MCASTQFKFIYLIQPLTGNYDELTSLQCILNFE